jgi:hypothetical protein
MTPLVILLNDICRSITDYSMVHVVRTNRHVFDAVHKIEESPLGLGRENFEKREQPMGPSHSHLSGYLAAQPAVAINLVGRMCRGWTPLVHESLGVEATLNNLWLAS